MCNPHVDFFFALAFARADGVLPFDLALAAGESGKGGAERLAAAQFRHAALHRKANESTGIVQHARVFAELTA